MRQLAAIPVDVPAKQYVPPTFEEIGLAIRDVESELVTHEQTFSTLTCELSASPTEQTLTNNPNGEWSVRTSLSVLHGVVVRLLTSKIDAINTAHLTEEDTRAQARSMKRGVTTRAQALLDKIETQVQSIDKHAKMAQAQAENNSTTTTATTSETASVLTPTTTEPITTPQQDVGDDVGKSVACEPLSQQTASQTTARKKKGKRKD